MKKITSIMAFSALAVFILLAAPLPAHAVELVVGASVPVKAPVTTSARYGVGVMPRLQFGLSDRLKLNLDVGAIMSAETGKWNAMEYPVLLGGTWEFGKSGDMGRPFLHLTAGYTHASDAMPDIESNHWITVGVGTGVNVHWKDTIFQVGFSLISPDVRGSAGHPVWMAFSLGVFHALVD